MARTLPTNIDPSWPKGTFLSACNYCSAAYMRHELRRNESGFLQCSGCGTGRDEVQLNRLNNEHAQRALLKKNNQRFDGGPNPNQRDLTAIHRTTAADILDIE